MIDYTRSSFQVQLYPDVLKLLRSRGKNVHQNIAIFDFQDGPIRHLGFSNFIFLLAGQVVCANTHQRTKFHQIWSNGCGDMAFNGFQNSDCPPSWIF